jgi:hypothetical protein
VFEEYADMNQPDNEPRRKTRKKHYNSADAVGAFLLGM